jgi:glycolate oxidase
MSAAVPSLSAQFLKDLQAIVGADGMIAGEQELLVYECDAYTLEKQRPGAVVLPRTTAEVAAIVRLCAKEKIPIIPRGAGTSLSGSVLAVTDGAYSVYPFGTFPVATMCPSRQ